MIGLPPDDSGSGAETVRGATVFSAQQTNLVRFVNRADHGWLDPSCRTASVTSLAPRELATFRDSWGQAPLECIRRINGAIKKIETPRRFARYLEAAVDLEILMDRATRPPSPRGSDKGRVGVPTYLPDGYVDLGIQTSPKPLPPKQKIIVDKQSLRPRLLNVRRRAVEAGRAEFVSLLRDFGDLLRVELHYDEDEDLSAHRDPTVEICNLADEHHVDGRHLALHLQLRLQEAGISSRLVKGRVRLFSFKLRHAWNIAMDDKTVALIDVAFGDAGKPFVIAGESNEEVYRKATAFDRRYEPSPDELQTFEIRAL